MSESSTNWEQDYKKAISLAWSLDLKLESLELHIFKALSPLKRSKLLAELNELSHLAFMEKLQINRIKRGNTAKRTAITRNLEDVLSERDSEQIWNKYKKTYEEEPVLKKFRTTTSPPMQNTLKPSESTAPATLLNEIGLLTCRCCGEKLGQEKQDSYTKLARKKIANSIRTPGKAGSMAIEDRLTFYSMTTTDLNSNCPTCLNY